MHGTQGQEPPDDAIIAVRYGQYKKFVAAAETCEMLRLVGWLVLKLIAVASLPGAAVLVNLIMSHK